MNFTHETFYLGSKSGSAQGYECSDCKTLFEYNILVRFDVATMPDGARVVGLAPKFCPNCGKKPDFISSKSSILPYA